MLRNKIQLEKCLEQAAVGTESFVTGVEAGRRNNLIDDDTGKLFTSLSEILRANLEALKILAGEIEASS